MKRDVALLELRQEMPRLQAVYGVRSLRLVGSTARDTATSESDIDLLVDFEEVPSLVTLGRIKSDLETKLGAPVEVLMGSGLRPRTRRQVLTEAIQV